MDNLLAVLLPNNYYIRDDVPSASQLVARYNVLDES